MFAYRSIQIHVYITCVRSFVRLFAITVQYYVCVSTYYIYIIMIDLAMHIAIKWHQNRSDILFSDNFISLGVCVCVVYVHIHELISLNGSSNGPELIGTTHFFVRCVH